MAAWQYGHENLHFYNLGRHLINYLQPVAGKVDVNLVSGPVLHMSDGVGLKHELPQLHTEGRPTVTVRMLLAVLLVQCFDCHPST